MNEELRERTATTMHERFCPGCNQTTVCRTYMSGYRGRVTVTTVCLACGWSQGRVC